MESGEYKRACPRCGSQNINYEIHSAGTISKSNYYRTGVKRSFLIPSGMSRRSSQSIHKSVGICQNCGYCWDVENDSPKQSQFGGCAFAIIYLMFWPITISVWFYKTDRLKLSKKWRAVIITVIWILLFILYEPTSA